MITYKDITINRRIIDKFTCDWCGKEFTEDDIKIFEVDHKIEHDFKLSYTITEGFGFDSGGNWKEWRVDLCLECIEKLRVLLEKNGIKIEESEGDF